MQVHQRKSEDNKIIVTFSGHCGAWGGKVFSLKDKEEREEYIRKNVEWYESAQKLQSEYCRMTSVKIAKEINTNRAWDSPDYKFTEVYFLGIRIYHKKPRLKRDYDSKKELERLGFTNIVECSQDFRFYSASLPEGWTFEEVGYYTEFYDSKKIRRLSQFEKYCSYDIRHFVDIL
jgi:hypothetical protein